MSPAFVFFYSPEYASLYERHPCRRDKGRTSIIDCRQSADIHSRRIHRGIPCPTMRAFTHSPVLQNLNHTSKHVVDDKLHDCRSCVYSSSDEYAAIPTLVASAALIAEGGMGTSASIG